MKNRTFLESKRRSYLQRPVNMLETRQKFLIVCEGEKTEPLYFKKFRVPKLVIDVEGLGFNTIRLVQEAIRLQREGKYDQVWCVFDRDSFPADHFNNAIQLAQQNGIQVAYSNEAFELWYLLHFHYFNAAISRKDYIDRLSQLMKRPYSKNSEAIYDELIEKQLTAIKYAKQLLDQYEPKRPHLDNPSTTVHLLVEQLIKFSH